MDNKNTNEQEEPKAPPRVKDWKGLETIAALNPIQISKESYISYDAVRAILAKDFAYFPNAMKARKFIGMLEKQYDVDLREWLLSYGETMDSPPREQGDAKILEHYPIDNNLNPQKTTAFGSILFFIVFVVGVVYFFLAGDDQNSVTVYDEKVTAVNSATAQNLEKSKKVLAAIDKTNTTDSTLTVIPLNGNRHKKSVAIGDKESIYNELNPDTSAIDILDRDIQIDYNQSILDVQDGQLSITTNLGRVWIGIVDADTYDKKSDIIEGEKTYEIFDNTILITGHGHVTLRSGESSFVIKVGQKQYFYYKHKSFVRLTRDEYLYLNKGIEW